MARRSGQASQRIRRRRLARRLAIFRQPILQGLDLLLEPSYFLSQGQQFGDQGFERSVFFAQGLQFFFLRHRCTLAGFLGFGKSVGDPLT
jgi:hypothetical protein